MNKSVAIGAGLLLAGGMAWAQQYLVTTVAGGGQPFTPAPSTSTPVQQPRGVAVDGAGNVYFSAGDSVFKLNGAGIVARVAGTSAQLAGPAGVAVDNAGNVYVAENAGGQVRKITPSGVITVAAGPVPGGMLHYPTGVAVDGAGNLYIADSQNQVIRKVAANGTLSIVAGNGSLGHTGDNGPATSAQLDDPYGVAVDGAGNVYIADSGNNAIRRVAAATGIITTVAGTGSAGHAGDGGLAVNAQLSWPSAVALDGAGNYYIADSTNNRVRKVSASGIITTVAGNGNGGYSGDGSAATGAMLNAPSSVAVSGGILYIADFNNNVVRMVAANGAISTVAGTGAWGSSGDGGAAAAAALNGPHGVAADSAGNYYIADTSNNRVRKVSSAGVITTVAGTGVAGYSGDGGQAITAQLSNPAGVAVDASGNVYIADSWNNVVRRVTTNGLIATVAGQRDGGPFYRPHDVAVDGSGYLYVVDGNRVRQVTPGGVFAFAGGLNAGNSGDGGQATGAQLDSPKGVAVDASGNVYIADQNNNVIRKVSNNIISTVAGNGNYGFAGDGGAATAARLYYPTGVAVDHSGNLYIADGQNFRIRKVANGTIGTVAGTGTSGYAGDGGPALSAQLKALNGIAVDSGGIVYFTDANVIRALTPQGVRALLRVAMTQSGAVSQGQAGVTYSVTVSDSTGAGATSGTVTVTVTVSTGLSLASLSGTGWSCASGACTRSDALAAGSSYPPITVTVNVAGDAPSQVAGQVIASGGGSVAASAGTSTVVIAGTAVAPTLVSPANGVTGVSPAPILTWNPSAGATSYDVYLGTLSTPPLVAHTAAASYAPGTLSSGTKYYWQIVAQTAVGSASSAIWSFTTGVPVSGSRFVAVTPCRVVDTRGAIGPFGGPSMTNGARSFAIPQSGCHIPSTAQAYSMNVTVVPHGPLSYLTLWPTGQTQPGVSTLNSFGGLVVANAAIVPAGAGGAVSVFVTNATDVILDINGYFDAADGANSYSFYAAPPCRIADTRTATGLFGGPFMFAGQTRDFPIPSSPCLLSVDAASYSLNATVVPHTSYLGYLSAWPAGQGRPGVSTLNSWTGKIVANAAIVPAGPNGSISVYVTDATDVILDTNGYFGRPGSAGALQFYPVAPCRIADTRQGAGAFGGPKMEAGTARSFAVPASACPVPSNAAAYSVNVTVVPDGRLAYLTAWPTGSARPYVSTLNSFDGAIVANAAIVPAGTNGAISVYVTDRTHVIVDINGYFAP